MANDSSPGTLDPYPAGSAIGFINYASTDEGCIRKVFTPFMEHMPFILLLETLVLVIVEKFTFKIPRQHLKLNYRLWILNVWRAYEQGWDSPNSNEQISLLVLFFMVKVTIKN